jgi:hypothetical protein
MILCWLALGLSLMLVGCAQQKPAVGGATNEGSANTEAAFAAEPAVGAQPARQPRPREPAPQSIDGPVHPFLTGLLRAYIAERGQVPSDFNEFARAKVDSVPRLPPGLKFAIDPVTQEVKIVAH